LRLLIALVSGVGVATLGLAVVVSLARRFLLIRRLSFPLIVAALAAGLKTVSLFQAGGFNFDDIVSWILIFLPAVVVLRIAGLFLFEYHIKGQRGIRLPPVLPPVVMGVAYVTAGILSLKAIFPTLDVAPLLATSAVGSLVIGLALQPFLVNLFAGVVISLERPFRMNDWIKVGDIEGRVVGVTWRTTRIRTRENDDVILPNGKISEETLINYYYPHPLHVEQVFVGADYKAPPYRVRRALLDAAHSVQGVLEKPSAEVHVLKFNDSAIDYELEFWIDDVAEKERIVSDVMERVWEEFKHAQINIPFPIRTLEILPRPRPAAAVEAGQAPRARIFIAEGPDRGRVFAVDGTPLVIGRSRACGLSLSDGQASKEHCRIEWTNEGYVVSDLASTQGTLVNGAKTQRAVLRDLDRIGVGSTTLVFESDGI
jgi:small-conductance mechanosensitive channel